MLDEPAAFDIERDVVEGFAGGEGGVAIFEKGEADGAHASLQVIAAIAHAWRASRGSNP